MISSLTTITSSITQHIRAYLDTDTNKQRYDVIAELLPNSSLFGFCEIPISERLTVSKTNIRDGFIQDFFKEFIAKKASYLRYEPKVTEKECSEHVLTKYLTKEQIAAINDCNINTQEVNDFIATLSQKDGLKTLLSTVKYDTLPLLALIAFLKTGQVTRDQVASLCFLERAIHDLIEYRETVVLTPEMNIESNTISTICYDIHELNKRFAPKLRTYSLFEKEDYLQKFFGMTGEQLASVKKDLLTKPDSEKYYHGIPVPIGVASWSPLYDGLIAINPSIMPAPVSLGTTKTFCEPFKMMIIPSISIYKAFLKTVYGSHAIKLEPVIGGNVLSQQIIQSHKLRDRRIVQLGIQQAPTSQYAHGIYCRNIGFIIHYLFFHARRDSEVRLSERRAIYHIVERVLMPLQTVKANALAWELLDGELYRRTENFGTLFDPQTVVWDLTLKTMVLKDLKKLENFWKSEFFITPTLLHNREKEIYNSIEVTESEKTQALINLFHYYQEKRKDPSLCTLHRFTNINDSETYIRMGVLFATGIKNLLEINDRSALAYFKLAAKKGNRVAWTNIGVMFYMGKGVEKNPKLAFKCIEFAAKKGDVLAHRYLGVFYEDGYEVERDFHKAFECYAFAAHRGDYSSCVNLSQCYQNGWGVEKDVSKAMYYMRIAADSGDTFAQQALPKLEILLKQESESRITPVT